MYGAQRQVCLAFYDLTHHSVQDVKPPFDYPRATRLPTSGLVATHDQRANAFHGLSRSGHACHAFEPTTVLQIIRFRREFTCARVFLDLKHLTPKPYISTRGSCPPFVSTYRTQFRMPVYESQRPGTALEGGGKKMFSFFYWKLSEMGIFELKTRTHFLACRRIMPCCFLGTKRPPIEVSEGYLRRFASAYCSCLQVTTAVRDFYSRGGISLADEELCRTITAY